MKHIAIVLISAALFTACDRGVETTTPAPPMTEPPVAPVAPAAPGTPATAPELAPTTPDAPATPAAPNGAAGDQDTTIKIPPPASSNGEQSSGATPVPPQ